MDVTIRTCCSSEQNVQKQRDSNIELFRIITMILIVAHHYVVNSGLTDFNGPIYTDALSWRSLFLLLFGAWGKTGINCFMLITGYFMCKSNITFKKYAKILGEVYFYRIVINLIFWISGYAEISTKALIKTILPVTQIAQNFTGTYLVFFLCIPFLNVLVQHMTEKQHAKLLALCVLIYVFFGTVHRVDMNYVSWYIVLYFISSYVRLYPRKIYSNTLLWGTCLTLSIVFSVISVLCCAWLSARMERSAAYLFVSDSNTFLAVLTGFCAFMFFRNIKLKYNPIINVIASSTFGVLLIHANSATMRTWLWKGLLDNMGAYHSTWMPVHALGSVIAIFVICTIIDVLRIRFIETPLLAVLDGKFSAIESKYKTFENKLMQKLGIQE